MDPSHGPILKDGQYYGFWAGLAILYLLTKIVDWYLLLRK